MSASKLDKRCYGAPPARQPRYKVPLTTGEDVQRVATLLATERLQPMPQSSQHVATYMPTGMPVGSQTVASHSVAYSAPASGKAVSAEAARAAAKFLEGANPTAIVWELRQVKSNQGGKYQAALAEKHEFARFATQRGQPNA